MVDKSLIRSRSNVLVKSDAMDGAPLLKMNKRHASTGSKDILEITLYIARAYR